MFSERSVPPTTDEAPISVLLPRLPSTDEILPWLRRIDERQIYSNYGPLWAEFRSGLTDYIRKLSGEDDVHIALTSNGTTAIELALRARALAGRSLCFMPSYTFIATAHAVANAGLEPFLLDVDRHSLVLTPEIAAEALRTAPSPPAAILVVSAFGAPPDVGAWQAFERDHGIPVVFDAAAAVTSLTSVATQPLCVSLHATKVFGIGEGGAVISSDRGLIDRITAMTGFGFGGSERLSIVRGGNYRISEYAAAVGLAVLAGIDIKLDRLKRVTNAYRGELSGADLRFQDGVGDEWVTMTLNVIVPPEKVATSISRLNAGQIQWRHWWGLGCHTHPAFSQSPRGDLSNTDNLATTVIGIPFFESLTEHQIARVCDALR